ncbi:pyridoxamine 5'-phosphate oxidase family protein [Ectothiorhodospiraceae bacterium WFHF3C12]|nr:pyridoxamine 5'-phosphate oxidase family protein [Ectothiorhodospiraceae bacterium WFHF3C12]
MTAPWQAEIHEILDGAQDMTVATLREDGYPQATTVSFVHQGLVIYFGCGRDSQKAHNIHRHPKISATVNLPYSSWNEIRGLSLAGRAHIVTDPEEEKRVLDAMLERFPQIRDFAEAGESEDMCLMRIDPEIISVLDYRKGFGHSELFRVHTDL